MFGKLLPREGNFFEMFNQHADRIVEPARAFEQLVPELQRPAPARAIQPSTSTTPSAPPTASRTTSTG